MKTEILIVGGGLGGVAAALAAVGAGCRVVLTEETDWLGGQMTSQAVPPDEHRWVERFGRTRRYAELRTRVREYYRRNFPLTAAARRDPELNPGGGWVSKLCHLPAVSAAVIEEMLAPERASGRLSVRYYAQAIAAEAGRGKVRRVQFRDLRTDHRFEVEADYVIDATELGDLLPLVNAEWVTGAEARSETGEPSAPEKANPEDVQAITWCFPLSYDPARKELREDYRIEKPREYDFWRNYTPTLEPAWPGRLLSFTYSNPKTREPRTAPLFPENGDLMKWHLWCYRKMIHAEHLEGHWHEATLVNWPQNDFFEESIIGRSAERKAALLERSRQLSLSLAYWLQNEAPREDGGSGFPGLYLNPDLAGTSDGLAKAAYIRESRRIRALFTVTECHVGTDARGEKWPEPFFDTVGVGSYRMDLHPSTSGRNYIDMGCYPFQIPMGALIPRGWDNLLAGAKNIGTTHISNGSYRLHPVEWNVGESAGSLAAFCLRTTRTPAAIRENAKWLNEYQQFLAHQGIELEWPNNQPR